MKGIAEMSAKHNAAFINVIAEEGTKAEAIEYLQKTWDELCELRLLLAEISQSPRNSKNHDDK